MRIERKRIGKLQSIKLRLAALRKDCRRAIRPIDVHLQIVCAAKFGDLSKRVYCARAGGSRICDYREGLQSACAIVNNAARQFIERQSKFGIGSNPGVLLRQKSRDAQSPLYRGMSLVAVINHRAFDAIVQLRYMIDVSDFAAAECAPLALATFAEKIST